MANQFMTLSLFIVLLSFFIVLNSMSTFEKEKAEVAMQSISVAFAKRNVDDSINPSFIESIKTNYNEGDTMLNIEALFRSQITNVDIKKTRTGSAMRVRLPVREFEKRLATSGTGIGKDSLMPTLVSFMQVQDRIPHSLNILVHSEDRVPELAAENVDRSHVLIAKAATYTEAMENLGVPTQLVSAGVAQGDTDYVDLVFQRYEPFRAVNEGDDMDISKPNRQAGESQ